MCYSIRNSSIGYCQGFNFLVLRLLEVLKGEVIYNFIILQEEAFWVFCELIEEILPLNYYSEMCGVMADMQIISNLLKTIMPQIWEILEEKDENCGDFIGNNLINQGLNNLFTNDMLNNDTSLLIWDCLFLEGNMILIKSFLALYACLSPILLKSKRNIENFKKIIDVDLKNIIPDNDELINYLFIKKFDFGENYINEERFKFSSQIAEAFENDTIDIIKSKLKISYDKQLEVQLDKTKSCNKNWPYCVNDTYFENVTQIVFYTTLSKQKMDEYQDNYFFEGLKIKNEKKAKEKKKGEIFNNKTKRKEEDRYNISIERRPHYCTHASEDININKNETLKENNIDINQKNEENNNKEKNIIDINQKNETNSNSNKEENNNINIEPANNIKKENKNDKDNQINQINEQSINCISSMKSDIEEVKYEEDLKQFEIQLF